MVKKLSLEKENSLNKTVYCEKHFKHTIWGRGQWKITRKWWRSLENLRLTQISMILKKKGFIKDPSQPNCLKSSPVKFGKGLRELHFNTVPAKIKQLWQKNVKIWPPQWNPGKHWIILLSQAFIQAFLSTAIFPQRFSFFTVCLVQWLNGVAPW